MFHRIYCSMSILFKLCEPLIPRLGDSGPKKRGRKSPPKKLLVLLLLNFVLTLWIMGGRLGQELIFFFVDLFCKYVKLMLQESKMSY